MNDFTSPFCCGFRVSSLLYNLYFIYQKDFMSAKNKAYGEMSELLLLYKSTAVLLKSSPHIVGSRYVKTAII